MATRIFLMCKFDGNSLGVKVDNDFTQAVLIQNVLSRWDVLRDVSFEMFYSIPGHARCLISCQDDVEVMVSLARAMKLEYVGVEIKVRGSGSGPSGNWDRMLFEYPTGQGGRDGMDGEDDMLSVFCPLPKKALLSDHWAEGLKEAGQIFKGGILEFRESLRKYAVQIGFTFQYIKNDKKMVTAECSLKEERDCKWRVHGRLDERNGFFYIWEFQRNHSCGAAYRTARNEKMNCNVVKSCLLDLVQNTPSTRPIDVVHTFKNDYGIEIPYHITWHGVKKARDDLYGDHESSYDQLRWYLDACRQTNPGSHLALDYDKETGHFKRLFVSFYATAHGFKYCRPMLFLDGTFLGGRYKGCLLAASANDGNNGLFPVAFAVVDTENDDNWYWFMTNLENIVAKERVLTFISDRHSGILEGVRKMFLDCFHSYCLNHLKNNMRDKLAGLKQAWKEKLVHKYSMMAYATTLDKYYQLREELRTEGMGRVENFLEDVPPDNFCNMFFKGKRYGEMSSNLAESFNAWIRDYRHLPIILMVDKIRCKVMNQLSVRHAESLLMTGFLCPVRDKMLSRMISDGRTWNVVECGNSVYEVHSIPSVLVDVDKKKCSCFGWQGNGFPCVHVCAAIQKSGQNIHSSVESFFLVEYYRMTYSEGIYGVPTFEKPEWNASEAVIIPPITKKQPGRPRKKRIPSRGEIPEIRCGRCKKNGHHNRKTCTASI